MISRSRMMKTPDGQGGMCRVAQVSEADPLAVATPLALLVPQGRHD